MEILFISDIHLSPAQPEIAQLFQIFITQRASQASALYILGDLFEAWPGDDDDSAFNQAIIHILHTLTQQQGVALYFLPGNRDFLIGERFAAATGCQRLPDPFLLSINGTKTLLSHGDAWCTDDQEHQQFRAQYLNPAWQQTILALPLSQRRALAQQYRMTSQQHLAMKDPAILDVNPQTIAQAMQTYHSYQWIHGHTHRPALHNGTLGTHKTQRLVLGDWQASTGNFLRYQPEQLCWIQFDHRLAEQISYCTTPL